MREDIKWARMPRLLREIAETVLDIPLDLGNWLQGFLPWEVPDDATDANSSLKLIS